MLLVQKVTSNPFQTQNLVLDDGTIIGLTLYFRPLQYGWFINELTYLDFTLKGLRICNSPNMLFQWQHKLPFGIACYSMANREPQLQQDFSSGNSKLYILTQAEVAAYTSFLENG